MINCSADQIYNFVNEISYFRDYCNSNLSDFEQIYSLIRDKCNTLRMIGENTFSKIHSSISKASYSIHLNECEIKSLKSKMYDVEQKINNTNDEEEKSALKKNKERIGNSIDNIKKMNDKLNELNYKLNNKAESIRKAIDSIMNIESTMNSIRSNIDKSKINYLSNLDDIETHANSARLYVERIDEALSYVSNTTKSSSKIISIKGPSYLFNIANSLHSVYDSINDSDNGLAKQIYGFTNITQHEVSRSVSKNSEEMLYKLNDDLKDFPSYSVKFNEAGNALKNYENLKLR